MKSQPARDNRQETMLLVHVHGGRQAHVIDTVSHGIRVCRCSPARASSDHCVAVACACHWLRSLSACAQSPLPPSRLLERCSASARSICHGREDLPLTRRRDGAHDASNQALGLLSASRTRGTRRPGARVHTFPSRDRALAHTRPFALRLLSRRGPND